MANSVRTSLFAFVVSLIFGGVCTQHLAFVAAPIIMLFYNGSLSLALWLALIGGLYTDAIELSPRFGLLGLSYLFTARLLYPARLYFFKDSIATLPAMTALFSLLSLCIEPVIALLFDISRPGMHPLDLLLQPVLDSFFAICIFMLPTFLWHQYRLRVSRRRYSDDS
jgi:hypothetical protein